jgi:hypothetical protein
MARAGADHAETGKLLLATLRDIAPGPVKITDAMRVHFPSLRTVFVALLFVFLALAFFPATGSGSAGNMGFQGLAINCRRGRIPRCNWPGVRMDRKPRANSGLFRGDCRLLLMGR